MRGDVVVELAAGWHAHDRLTGEVIGPGGRTELDPETAAHWVARGWAVPVVAERVA